MYVCNNTYGLSSVILSTQDLNIMIHDANEQGGRGHWAFYYTGQQIYIITFSHSLAYQLWRTFIEFNT